MRLGRDGSGFRVLLGGSLVISMPQAKIGGGGGGGSRHAEVPVPTCRVPSRLSGGPPKRPSPPPRKAPVD